MKLKKGEYVYHQNGHLLCLPWCDKRPVTLLSIIHEVGEVVTKRKYNGEILLKPIVVHHYNNYMNFIHKTDHLLSSYIALKGNKWYRKLFLYIFNMTLLNSYILNHKYGEKKLSHAACREYIASHLITTSLPHATCTPKRQQTNQELEHGRLKGKHFPMKMVGTSNENKRKRKYLAKCYKICNFTQQQRHHYMHVGPSLPTKYTTFTCNICREIPMCVTPCFEIFHTEIHYRNCAL